MDDNSDEDPLALESEVDNNSIVYDVNSYIEPEIILEDCAPLRRSKRCSVQERIPLQNPEKLHLSVDAAAAIGPLFPITPKMQQRIKRMKQRMLATLQISDNPASERSKRRAKQTTESCQEEASKELGTAEQMTPRANKSAESPRRLVKTRPEKQPTRRVYKAGV